MLRRHRQHRVLGSASPAEGQEVFQEFLLNLDQLSAFRTVAHSQDLGERVLDVHPHAVNRGLHVVPDEVLKVVQETHEIVLGQKGTLRAEVDPGSELQHRPRILEDLRTFEQSVGET